MFNFSLTFTPERENPIWPPRAIYGHTSFFLWQIYVKSFFSYERIFLHWLLKKTIFKVLGGSNRYLRVLWLLRAKKTILIKTNFHKYLWFLFKTCSPVGVQNIVDIKRNDFHQWKCTKRVFKISKITIFHRKSYIFDKKALKIENNY